MKINVTRRKPSKDTLKNLYDLLNKIIKKDAFFYTEKELAELKKNTKNVFLD